MIFIIICLDFTHFYYNAIGELKGAINAHSQVKQRPPCPNGDNIDVVT